MTFDQNLKQKRLSVRLSACLSVCVCLYPIVYVCVCVWLVQNNYIRQTIIDSTIIMYNFTNSLALCVSHFCLGFCSVFLSFLFFLLLRVVETFPVHCKLCCQRIYNKYKKNRNKNKNRFNSFSFAQLKSLRINFEILISGVRGGLGGGGLENEDKERNSTKCACLISAQLNASTLYMSHRYRQRYHYHNRLSFIVIVSNLHTTH